MAISENLKDLNSPYVHSNIYNMIDSVSSFFSTSEEGKAVDELTETVEKFENWIQILQNYEHELYSFLGVPDWQGLNVKLFSYGKGSNRIDNIAQQTILEPNVISKLQMEFTQEHIKKIANLLKKNKSVFNKLIEEDLEIISLSQFRQAVFEYLQKNLGKNSKVTKEQALTLIGDKELKKAINEDLKDWKGKAEVNAKSKSSLVHQLANSILTQSLDAFEISEDKFESAFYNSFYKNLQLAQIPLVDTDLETVAKEYTKLLYQQIFAGKKFANLSAVVGERGESMLQFLMAANGLKDGIESYKADLSIFAVGQKSEKEVEDIIKKIVGNNNIKAQMDDYTLGGKNTQSGTDLLVSITTPEGKKVFRIQSKDSVLRWLEGLDANESNRPFQVIMKENKILTILEKLKQKALLSQQDCNELGYYIANLIWFHEKGSYEDGKIVKRTRGFKGGLGGAQEIINQIISKGIQAFIGVTIDENNVNSLNLNASNIFYFLGARTIFPVSEVLKAAVEDLKNLRSELFNLNFKIDMSSASFNPDDVKKFYESKRDKVETFGGRTYSDSGLLDIGKAQGRTIMESTEGAITFNFKIDKILRTSSYVF